MQSVKPGKRVYRSAILIGVVLLILFYIVGQHVFAVETTRTAPFSVEPVVENENQIAKNVSYFDLLMVQNQESTILVKVHNNRNELTKVKSELTPGTTANNGKISYVTLPKKMDSTLKYPFNTISSLSDGTVIELKPLETKVISAKIKMPSEIFKGVIAGGWHFSEVSDATKNEQKNKINSLISYVVGVKLTEGGEVSPDLKINRVRAGLDNGYKSILTNIQNTEAVILSKTKIEGKITKRGEKEVLKSSVLNDVAFAPNSNFDFSTLFGDTQFVGGRYTIHLKITSQDPKLPTPRKWKFTRHFNISDSEASQYNGLALDPKPPVNPVWYVVMGVVITVIVISVGVLIWLYVKHNRLKKNEKNVEKEE